MSWSVSEATVTYKGAWKWARTDSAPSGSPEAGSALHCAAQPKAVWITWSLSETHSANPALRRRRFRPDWGRSTYRQTAWLHLEMHFLQTEGLWQARPCLASPLAPSSQQHLLTLCLCVTFWNSWNISNLLLLYLSWLSVIPAVTNLTHWRLKQWSALFSNEVFLISGLHSCLESTLVHT